MIDPHGMDPRTVLRFVKMVGGWPGKVVVIACEPAVAEEMGLALSPEVEGSVEEQAVELVLEAIAELDRRRLRRDGAEVHELSISSAIVDTSLRTPAGARCPRSASRRAPCARWCRRACGSTSRSSPVTRPARERGSSSRSSRRGSLRRLRARVGPGAQPRSDLALRPVLPSFRCPDCGPAAGADVIRGDELEVESIEVVERGGTMHRTHG